MPTEDLSAYLEKEHDKRRAKYNDYWRETRRLAKKYFNTRISRVPREEFTNLIASVIEYNPNWTGAALMAINSGVIHALDRDGDAIRHLTTALRWFIANTPEDVLKANQNEIDKGIRELVRTYPNSPLADDLAEMFGYDLNKWKWDMENRPEPARRKKKSG